ncbi:MAG: flavodoxin [Clostridia bacterium]|nr:flavodoxin [Clostridia bacterium]
MSKKLVAFFSASGVTASVAKKLADVLSADIFEIKPKTPYTEKDLDWRNPLSRSSVEMQNRDIRPEIEDKDAKISSYDTVFLGFPIWWYVAPTLINTFLEKYDFSGKKIVLFATSGGSGFGKTADGLKGSVAKDTVIIEGKLFSRDVTAEELKKWAENF